MITIAFAFIVQHGTIEWKALTGGQNGLMGLAPPTRRRPVRRAREWRCLRSCSRALALSVPALRRERLGQGDGGGARQRNRRALDRAQSGDDQDRVALPISAVFAGLAGAIFAPLMMFVAPDSFPFSQSILFLLAVIVGGAGWVFGPVVGAVVTVMLPELLSQLAEYRLLFVGALLLVVLWVAPEGVIGTLARLAAGSIRRPTRVAPKTDLAAFLRPAWTRRDLIVRGIGIAFGGIKAATDVSFAAQPGRITSVIGPNGAGKTDRAQHDRRLLPPRRGQHPARRRRARRRAGLARGARRHRAHLSDHAAVRRHERDRQRPDRAAPRPARQSARRAGRRATSRRVAEALLAFVGYHGPLATLAARDLPTSIAAWSRLRARWRRARACCCSTSRRPA